MLSTLQIAFPADSSSGASLSFGVSNSLGASKSVAGVAAVEQHFIKLMLTELGSNVFDTTEGVALKEILSKRVGDKNVLSLRNAIAMGVASTEARIIQSQSGLSLAPSETVMSIVIQSIDYDETAGWRLSVRINMADRNYSELSLEM